MNGSGPLCCIGMIILLLNHIICASMASGKYFLGLKSIILSASMHWIVLTKQSSM